MDNLIEKNTEEHDQIIARLDEMANEFVTKDRFSPVEKIVYTIIGAAAFYVLNQVFHVVNIHPSI